MAEPIEIKTYSQSGDIFDNTFFDTAVLDTANVQYDLFSTPLSATKKQDLTNMTDPGQFPTGLQFQTQQIGIRIYQATTPLTVLKTGLFLGGLFQAMSKASLTFNIIGKQNLGSWPLSEFLGITNLVTTPVTAGDSDNAGLSNYVPVWKKLRYPINLDQRVRFSVSLQFFNVAGLTSDVAGFAIQVLLKGTEQRRK